MCSVRGLSNADAKPGAAGARMLQRGGRRLPHVEFITMFTPHSEKCCLLSSHKQNRGITQKGLDGESKSETALNCINVLYSTVYREHCEFVEF